MDHESADSTASRLLKAFFDKHGQSQPIPLATPAAGAVEFTTGKNGKFPLQNSTSLKS